MDCAVGRTTQTPCDRRRVVDRIRQDQGRGTVIHRVRVRVSVRGRVRVRVRVMVKISVRVRVRAG